MAKHELIDQKRRALIGAGGALLLGAAWPARALAQTGGGKGKIGIIGSGKIGGTIGGLWVKAGHSVFFSSRHPEELKDLVSGLGSLAQAGTVAQAVAFGDVIFVAVPYKALPEVGKENAAGLVRDAGFDPVVVGKLADARRFQRGQPGYGQQVSAAELKQKLSLP